MQHRRLTFIATLFLTTSTSTISVAQHFAVFLKIENQADASIYLPELVGTWKADGSLAELSPQKTISFFANNNQNTIGMTTKYKTANNTEEKVTYSIKTFRICDNSGTDINIICAENDQDIEASGCSQAWYKIIPSADSLEITSMYLFSGDIQKILTANCSMAVARTKTGFNVITIDCHQQSCEEFLSQNYSLLFERSPLKVVYRRKKQSDG